MYVLFFISFLGVFMLNSCTHTPQKIEKYTKKHCGFETTDTCYIDLRKALKTDYDTMYVFNSLIPLTGVQNILGIHDYGKCKNPEITLIGRDSEMCRVILVKNHKVVYEDEYHYNHYDTKLLYHDFMLVKGHGIFDGGHIEVEGYMSTNYIFKISKTNDNHYLATEQQATIK